MYIDDRFKGVIDTLQEQYKSITNMQDKVKFIQTIENESIEVMKEINNPEDYIRVEDLPF